jgi:hypothetical protein
MQQLFNCRQMLNTTIANNVPTITIRIKKVLLAARVNQNGKAAVTAEAQVKNVFTA